MAGSRIAQARQIDRVPSMQVPLDSGLETRFQSLAGQRKVIALHLGGFYMLDEAERELIGRENVLIDTTWPPSIKEVGADTLTKIINKHGVDKVCFGTDFPLASQEADAAFIEGLAISGNDKERILGENAREFIGI